MEIQAKTIKTPVGVYPAPLNPNFIELLKDCETNEDLFALVRTNGFINPDAFNEVQERSLYLNFLDWEKQKLAFDWSSLDKLK